MKQTGTGADQHAQHAIRLLALDLDGTLLTNDKRLTERTKQALLAAADAGILPVIVTGRPLSGLPEAVRTLSCVRYVITSNGASARDLATGEVLRTACLDSGTAEEIVRIPMEHGLIHSAFIDGTGYCEPQFLEQQILFFQGTPIESYVRKSRKAAEDIAALIRQHPDGVENIWCIAADQAERDEIAGVINSRWEVQTVLTGLRDVEVGSMEADKGAAVTELAARFGIQKEEILAIGDNDNDLSMFRAAGTNVVMGNAPEYIRSRANYVADTNERDGAAKVIESVTACGILHSSAGGHDIR